MPFLGSYQLLTRIATGGMAEVFLARRPGAGGFSKVVAVKRILPAFSENPEFVALFLNEAKLSGQLEHPNIVQSLELGRDGATYFLAMEYVDGPTLRDMLRAAQAKQERLSIGVALKIVSQVLEGLAFAHELRGPEGEPLQLVHRDISPHNVLLGRAGSVKVADFGIARAASIPSVTKTGSIRGKVRYMSPEQLEDKVLDARSDLFAVGVTLYEALTGERPFPGESEVEVIGNILNTPPPPLESKLGPVPAPLQALLDRALAKDRDQRFESASQMQAEVEQTLVQLGMSVRGTDIAALVAAYCPPNPEIAAALNLPDETPPEPATLDEPLPEEASDQASPEGSTPRVPAAALDRKPVETLWTGRGAAAWGAQAMPEAPPRIIPQPRPEGSVSLAKLYGPTDRSNALQRPEPKWQKPAAIATGLVALVLAGAGLVAVLLHGQSREEASTDVVVVPVAKPVSQLASDAGPASPETRIAALPPAPYVDGGSTSLPLAINDPTPLPPMPVDPPRAMPPQGHGGSSASNKNPSWLITPGHDSKSGLLITPNHPVSRAEMEDTDVPPEPPSEPTYHGWQPGHGKVELHVSPRGEVAIDDENRGMVHDMTATLEVGEHVVRVWALNGQNHSYKFYLRPNETHIINFNY